MVQNQKFGLTFQGFFMLCRNCKDEQIKFIITFLFFTGISLSALTRLKVKDILSNCQVEYKDKRCYEGKAIWFYNPVFYDYLLEFTKGKKRNEYIFTKSDGSPFTIDEVKNIFNDALKEIGINENIKLSSFKGGRYGFPKAKWRITKYWIDSILKRKEIEIKICKIYNIKTEKEKQERELMELFGATA